MNSASEPPVDTFPPAGWLPDVSIPGALRWWDGSQWTDQLIAPAAKLPSARVEKFCASACHLGTIFGGPLLPLVFWSASPTGSLRRLHTRQAFAYQMVYLPFYVFFFFRAALLTNNFGPVFTCMAVGLALAMPQMIRARNGKPPLPWPPFFRLRE